MNRPQRLPSCTKERQSVRRVPRRSGSSVAVGLAVGLGLLGLVTAARADLAPGPPPPECVGKPDGTLCVLQNGTAGQCKTGPWGRQPGRTWVSCEPDKHECDRLELNAVCHGYLGQPAHCKEFTSAEKTTWRTCQVDGAAAPAADRSADPPATPGAPPAATKKGLLSCAAVPGAAGAGNTGALMLWAAALWLTARRRSSARSYSDAAKE